uniref:NADH dehydrogenase subunit 5 n=1 Tax=Mengenilla moldrzyki TaxID=1155016 RepID=UPI0018E26FC4|nr:NADH dehydrogenase subunit 5 [Mengenilla moldrzyki]
MYDMMKLFFYMSMMFSLMLFLFVMVLFFNKDMIMVEWEIFNFYSLDFGFIILLDWVSLLFMSYVLFISGWVMLYSSNYMEMDKFKDRFYILLILFVISMLLLVISPNLISLLLGWDGLGLISYCLVAYYQNFSSYNSSMVTFLSNRIGDSFLLVSIFFMMNYGGWNFIFYEYLEFNFIMLMLIILASMTKSAQIPFSLWLPMAMAAPTPVSSLVHSSTLVTAGVYLLIRFYDFFIIYVNQFMLLMLLFMLTMLLSSVSALMEIDLKKIIALSTLSQLSLMMMMLLMGFKELAFFHLLIHAIFKSLLFLCSGVIIHDYKYYQDIRMMGSYSKMMPMISCYLNISGLSLCGMPFLSSYFTKDYVMELLLSENNINMMMMMLYYICIGLTMLYYFRLIYYLNFSWFNLSSLYYFIDNKWLMMNSMKLLMIFSLIFGSIMSWLFLDNMKIIMMDNYLSAMIYLMMLFILIKFLEKYFYMVELSMSEVKMFLLNMWYLKMFFVNNIIMMFSVNMNYFMEKGWGELLGSQGIYLMYKNMSMIYQIYQFNNIKYYLIMFIMMFYLIIYL